MSNCIIGDRFYISPEIISSIKAYSGATFVIKYGGSVMKDKLLQYYMVQDIVLLSSFGIRIILVHGGGYAINQWLEKLDIQPVFKDGVRVTDKNSIEVVEMVLSASVNKDLVLQLNNNHTPAIGLSGKDANLIQASSLSGMNDDYTGKIDCVNPSILRLLLSNGILPVVSSIASDVSGNTYNVNADTVASYIAASIGADKYILMTDTPGVLKDISNPKTLIKKLNIAQISRLKAEGVISGGMIPKLDSCIYCLGANVTEAHIIDGRVRYSLLSEILNIEGSGSMIVK